MKISHDFGTYKCRDEASSTFGQMERYPVPLQSRRRSVAPSRIPNARQIDVSAEIVGILGSGLFTRTPLDAMFLYFGPDECSTRAEIDPINAENDQAVAIAFAVSRRACVRLFAVLPPLDGRWHMPHELRALRQSLIAITNDDEASQLLLSARSIELLCAFFAAFSNNQLVQANGSTTLREEEIALVVAAHKIVSENWHERLTVCGIARRCGMSRSKLTRGYREIYCTTIGEAVIERRLDGARRLLAESDLHISTVGYRCGYTNNASFSRAFTRRFGMTPSTMRRRERSVLGSMPTLAGNS